MKQTSACAASFILLLTVPVLCSFPSAQAAEDTNTAHVRPFAVIPFMKTPPEIDGVVRPGEWNTLHVARFVEQGADLLERKPGEFWIGCDHKKLYVAVRSAFHPVHGIVANLLPRGNADVNTVFDDAIELWVDTSPDSATGRYYQVLVNSKGAIWDALFDHRDKIAQKWWRVSMQQAHSVRDGVWTAEFAIDLASLGITDPTKEIGMRVCRDYKYPWDQARWEPLVHSFDAPETMARIRFASAAPVIEEGSIQDATGINIGMRVSNPTAHPLPLGVRLGYNPQDQPRYYSTNDIVLQPGEERTVEYKKDFFTPGGYAALGEAMVTDGQGNLLYHRDFKWLTKPTTPVWDATATADVAQVTHLDIAWYPSFDRLRWTGDYRNLSGKEKIKGVRLVVRDHQTGNLIQEQHRTSLPGGSVAGDMTLPGLPSGSYVAEMYLDGTSPSAKPVQTAPFLHRNDFPWKDNKLGIGDDIVPPFTPIRVKGQVVSTILRDHTVSMQGLWSQVRSEGIDLLAAPMRFEVTPGGKSGEDHPAQVITAKPDRVVVNSHLNNQDLPASTMSEFDYDGCMKVTLDIPAQPTRTLQGLDLVIPLKDSEASLMHVCGEGLRSNYAGFVPAGQGVVWTSAHASRDQLIGTFVPYIFVGGPERGLVWFASNDRDWSVDPTGKVEAVTLARSRGVLTLRVHLFAIPTRLDHAHHIVFGLMATPAKPMPQNPNWRTMSFVGDGPFDVHIFGSSMYWGADLYSTYPRGHDYHIISELASALKGGEYHPDFFSRYMQENPDIRNEVNSVAHPGHFQALIPYTNIRGEITNNPDWVVYQDEWRGTPFAERTAQPTPGNIDGTEVPVRSRQDYLLYNYKQILDHGFDGIYWDNMFIFDNANPLTGRSYTRPDGLVQPDTDIWLLRELARRTAVMFHQLGKRNLTMPHQTNAYLIPVFSWATTGLDWEMQYGGTDFQDRFSRDYIRAASMGRQSGQTPVVLQGITEVKDPAKFAWVARTRLGVVLPHEITIWQPDPLYVSIRKSLYEMGYGKDACQVYHYFDDHPVASLGGIDGIWAIFAGKDQVALLVTDYGGGGAAQLKLDVRKLRLPPDFTATDWEKPDESYTAQNGILQIPGIAKHDFRFVIVKRQPRSGS